ncbi:alpha/beta hydrolase [Fodinisporobacter ferrooxydans]|uniref:Alpha/beta hydrolase n=1 Tax=Fodinisporobacter ferrooxydans TaxID=2901836 RepID=A0ABY4CNF9_9BACL|nr:alpha/beta hydrolase [Alicyclobacillaceae bacterium MYW30-H2]
MPLDPQAQTFLVQNAGTDFSVVKTMPLDQSRNMHVESVINYHRVLEPVAQVKDIEIPGPYGLIPIRIYIPDGKNSFPLLLWFHGGGWVWGNLETADEACRVIANKANCIVVSVDYRLAPEHTFPIAIEEAYAAIKWAYENASEVHGDPSRIAVGGDSAGGNLAAVASMMARDRNGPKIIYQLLVYPVIDSRLSTESFQHFENGYSLTKEKMKWFWEQYAPGIADQQHPYAAPVFAGNLRNLPPALVITAEFDPLRDEGEAYANMLKEAGVSARCIRFDGMIHGFFTRVAAFDQAMRAIEEAAQELHKVFQ